MNTNLPAIAEGPNVDGNMPLVTTEAASNAAMSLSDASIRLLARTYYPDASPEMIRLMHGFCVSRGVDHCMRPGYIVKTGGKESIWPSIHLYRVIAHRSMYAGTSRPEYGPDVTLPNGITGPEWVRMKIKRRLPDGSTAKFWAEAMLREHAKPTPMWRAMARHMLTIRCEAIGLRAAFPEVGGMPTWEEVRDEQGASELETIQPPRQIANPTSQPAPVSAEAIDAVPVEPATTGERITAGMAAQIKRRMQHAGIDLEAMSLAVGRELQPDLLDMTKAEWEAAKPKIAEYAAALKSGEVGHADA